MDRFNRAAALAAIALAALVLLAAVPLVEYSAPFTMSADPNATPTSLTGRSTILYVLTGIGEGPYPPLMLVPQGASAALIHFEGSRLGYWEGPFSANTALNPQGVVKVTNASITQWIFGLLNFTFALKNTGALPIWNLTVLFHYPSYGKNQTYAGITRSTAETIVCSLNLPPSRTCSVTFTLPQSPTLLTDEKYPMEVEAISQGPPSANYAPAFVYVHATKLRYPGAGLSPQWVKAFIQAVNARRTGAPLREDTALDAFAAFRYNSLRAQYQISDFNFTADYNRYFGASAPTLFEEILYPAGRNPATYPDYLQKNAPGHWAGLTNPLYTRYGFFFGTGPSVDIGPRCPATEIPGPNINITSFVISQGCTFVVADEIWFILILGA